jgi:DUF971 family protein
MVLAFSYFMMPSQLRTLCESNGRVTEYQLACFKVVSQNMKCRLNKTMRTWEKIVCLLDKNQMQIFKIQTRGANNYAVMLRFNDTYTVYIMTMLFSGPF